MTCSDIETNPGPGYGGGQDDLKKLLSSVNKFDRFEIRSHLERLNFLGEPKSDFYQMRLQLEKTILSEMIKQEPQNGLLQSRVRDINKLLGEKAKGYSCLLSGCYFIADRHDQYIKHIKIAHPRVKNCICNFKHICLRNFASIEELIRHIKEDHSSVSVGPSSNKGVAAAVINIACKCDMVSCGSVPKQFSKISDLLKHINTDHLTEMRMCVFENCSTRFNPYSASRHHFRIKHLNTGDIQLKSSHSLGSSSNPLVLNPEVLSIGDGELHEGVEEGYDAFDIDALENMETFDEDVGSEDYFLQYYADFYNRLVHHKFLPQSTVQDISEEYYKSSKKSQEIRERKLRETLERVADLSPEDVDEIVRDVIEDDFFIRAQSKLNTQYKRTKYVQENMKYCAPIEILLNKSEVERGLAKDVIHYVPLDLSIKTLVEDASMIQMMEKERGKSKQDSRRIADIKDGSQIRKNPFFRDNPGASGILLYSDGVELVNPLGAARGVYKIVQMFYT